MLPGLFGQRDSLATTIAEFRHDLTVLLRQGQRALPDLPYKVKGLLGAAPQGHFQGVLFHGGRQCLLHLLVAYKEPVHRNQPVYPLVGTLEIIVLDPGPDALAGLLQVSGRHPGEAFLPQTLPEPFHLPAGLRVPRRAAHVPDPLFFEFLLELGFPAPTGIRRSVIRQQFPGNPIIGNRPAQNLDEALGMGAGYQLPAHDEAGMVIQEGHQLGLATVPEAHRKEIRLPHFAGLGALETAHLRRPAFDLLRVGRRALPVQHAAHRLPAHLLVPLPPEKLGNLPDAEIGKPSLGLHDLPGDGFRNRRPDRTAFGMGAIGTGAGKISCLHRPPAHRIPTDAEAFAYRLIAARLLPKIGHHLGLELGGIITVRPAADCVNFSRPPPSPLGERAVLSLLLSSSFLLL